MEMHFSDDKASRPRLLAVAIHLPPNMPGHCNAAVLANLMHHAFPCSSRAVGTSTERLVVSVEVSAVTTDRTAMTSLAAAKLSHVSEVALGHFHAVARVSVHGVKVYEGR